MDPYEHILGLDLPPERLQEILSSYAAILESIRRLSELDLTDVHPAIVFEPSAPYRMEPDA
jgi:putative NADH-flavin reductase